MRIYARPPNANVRFTIADGKRGILETVALMRRLVDQYKLDPEIRSLALSLIGGVREKDALGEIEACFYFVRDCIRYVMDIYDVETLHTPDRLLAIGQGDCDDKATLLASLLESIGYETAFKVVGYNGPDFQHVYLIASGHGVMIPLDPTEPEPAGWEAPDPTVSIVFGSDHLPHVE
jgi:transglutaminase-like putative cysteine protease